MLRTLELFEHGRLPVAEGDAGLRLHEFESLVRFNDEHRGRYFDVGHRHLKAKSYVGYVQVGDVAIEILPKADRHAPPDAQPWREGLLEMLRVGMGLDLERLPSASQRTGRSPLIELVARAYLAELDILLREGLAKGYRAVQENGVVFRGRLKVADHIRLNVARGDRFYVEYQAFDHHIVVNQVLAAALDVLSWCALSPGTACTVDAFSGRLPDLSVRGITDGVFDRIRLTRATRRYDKALTYARMILAHQGPQLRTGRARVFALLFDMNALWERYVATLLRRVASPGLHVRAQERHAFWRPLQHDARQVRPDIVLRGPADEVLLVIDTKWKVPTRGLPSDDDLKQMFVYNELLGGPRSMLLYPRTATSFEASGIYATKTHACEQRHVGVLDGGAWSTAKVAAQLGELLSDVTCGRVLQPSSRDGKLGLT